MIGGLEAAIDQKRWTESPLRNPLSLDYFEEEPSVIGLVEVNAFFNIRAGLHLMADDGDAAFRDVEYILDLMRMTKSLKGGGGRPCRDG